MFSFRSAFVTNEEDTTDRKTSIDTFITFSIRLSKLLERKLQLMSTSTRDHLSTIKNTNRPLLRLRTITHIIELYPFFKCLTYMHPYHYQHSLSNHTTLSNNNQPIPVLKRKELSKKKNKFLLNVSSYRKTESKTINSTQGEAMSDIETSVLEDFVESWT